MTNKSILVFAQQTDGLLHSVSLELLGKARELAGQLGATVTAALLGADIEKLAMQLARRGADKVISVDHPDLAIYKTEPYAASLAAVIEREQPEIVLIGATAIGRDLAPRLSARLRTGLTADCTGLNIDPESSNLLMTRPAFGGNIMATIVCETHRPQMATVRPGVMQKLPEQGNGGCIFESFPAKVPDTWGIEVLDVVMQKLEHEAVTEADVLVSGGRGVGSKEGFAVLDRLAKALGGTIASSRASVDLGWTKPDRQAGQTGSTVRPKLYLACGISGQIQHLAGMENAEYIVSINKDPNAPIFGVSDLSVVGDLNKILPELEKLLSAEER